MTAYISKTHDAGPILHRPTGLPITVGCDTAWIWTRVSVVAPQALRCSAFDRCATREPQLLYVLPEIATTVGKPLLCEGGIMWGISHSFAKAMQLPKLF